MFTKRIVRELQPIMATNAARFGMGPWIFPDCLFGGFLANFWSFFVCPLYYLTSVPIAGALSAARRLSDSATKTTSLATQRGLCYLRMII